MFDLFGEVADHAQHQHLAERVTAFQARIAFW
jgi:hypothetical protein